MLGRLRMSVQECISTYLMLSDQVFQQRKYKVSTKPKTQGSFDTQKLEQAVKQVIKAQGLQEDTLLKTRPMLLAKCELTSGTL